MGFDGTARTAVEGVDFSSINRAFTKQSNHYDQQDASNPVLVAWRQQVYQHVEKFLKAKSHILELNAGTGIDALHFIKQGHSVHCTDLSDGMIQQINTKIQAHDLKGKLTSQQCSYEALNGVEGKFDFVFSNFGGLNCIDDLTKVAIHLPSLLKPGALVTWVVMPPVCGWEILSVLKGQTRMAFRRLNRNGTMAHVEGEYFKTYYYSLRQIKKALGHQFHLLKCEGLGALTPPPAETSFQLKHPKINRFLSGLDHSLREHFPFNRWADHIITTFRYETI